MTSSFWTRKYSEDYPHTQAIRTQDAKYRSVPVNDNRDRRYQYNQPGNEQRRTTTRAQQPGQETTRNQQPQAVNPAPATQQATGNISAYARQVVDLTNEQRRINGLAPLQIDTRLSYVAQTKSQDMQSKGYFSHTSPTYGSPFDMMRDFGVSYRTAGENIAQGQRTPQEVVNAWMNSAGHRQNILNGNFTHIGVGYEASGKHWTQMFIGK